MGTWHGITIIGGRALVSRWVSDVTAPRVEDYLHVFRSLAKGQLVPMMLTAYNPLKISLKPKEVTNGRTDNAV